MTDTFFTQKNCDRCLKSLEGLSRTMSWFTEDCLCASCTINEKKYRDKLDRQGINTCDLEGCGYMPEDKEEI